MSLDQAREWLTSLGLPPGEPDTLVASTGRFADGGAYKWEVAGAFDAQSVHELVALLAPHGVQLHQVTNTVGTMRYLDAELRDLVEACAGHRVQLRMAVGPRGQFDLGAQKLAAGAVAAASAYRLRGADQLVQALDDVAHAVDLGVRGFLVFDEGLLTVLDQLRAAGSLPAGLRFKASSNMGAGNPAHVRLLAAAGADSVNLQRDLDLRMLAAVRAATPVALDLHTDNPRSTGGFVRTYDVPEMVRVAAPVYLKTGNAAQDFSDAPPRGEQLAAVAHQLLLDHQTLVRLLPTARPSDEPEL